LIVGIDIGASTTKAVALEELRTAKLISVKTTEAITSASTALEKLLTLMNRSSRDVTVIAVSGGGARSVEETLLGIPVAKVDEIKAIGVGGLALSGKKQALIVSMGTGTALVAAYKEGRRVVHIGGTGVGGGTLQGLSMRLLHTYNFENIEKMAAAGDASKVDLTVADIAGGPVGIVSGKATASNFGRLSTDANENDVAAAIFNMVSQVIGAIVAFAAKAYGLEKDVVLVGRLAGNNLITKSIGDVADMFHIRLHIPENGRYCVAIGAAKSTYINQPGIEKTFPDSL
jgi:type II pantothenate kinase